MSRPDHKEHNDENETVVIPSRQQHRQSHPQGSPPEVKPESVAPPVGWVTGEPSNAKDDKESDRHNVSNMKPTNHSERSVWQYVCQSIRGVSHERSGTVCQDSHAHLLHKDYLLLAAIADGAGSAPKSDIGSMIAAQTAVESLKYDFGDEPSDRRSENEWRQIMIKAMERAKEAVIAKSQELGVRERELASTLIVVAAACDGILVGQIGDGAVVVEDTHGKLQALTLPQSGEFINETTFLISPNAIEQAQIVLWHGKVLNLAAFSDGLQMLALKMSEGIPHPPFFTPLFNFVKSINDPKEAENQLHAFLTSPRISDRSDDDLTLLLAHWKHGIPPD